MEEISTRAELVSAASAEGAGLTATLPRREIEEVLAAGDAEPELLLDVVRSPREGDDGRESRRFAVAWERGDLETLLNEAPGDTLTLGFDPEAISRLFDEDVEAHGLREKAAILTVALATVGGAAGAAQAMTQGKLDSGGVAAGYTTVEQTRGGGLGAGYSAVEEARDLGAATEGGVPGGISAAEQVRSDQGSGVPAGVSAAEQVRDPAAADEGGVPGGISAAEEVRTDPGSGVPAGVSAAEQVRDPAAADEGGVPGGISAAEEVRTDPGSGVPAGVSAAEQVRDPGAAAPDTGIAGGFSAVEEVRGPEPAVPAGISAVEDIRTPDTPAATDTGGGGISVEAPSPGVTGAIVGAFALAIAGAAFVSRRRRPGPAPA